MESFTAQKIMRASFDGSDFEVVFDAVDGVSEGTGVAVDPVSGYIFWTNFNSNSIQRGLIDGTGDVETLFTGRNGPVGIAADTSTEKLYWAQQGSSQLFRGNQSGLGTPELVSATGNGATGVALDQGNGKVYWANFTDNTIERSDLDGGNRETLFNAGDGVNAPAGVSVDTDGGLLYNCDANGVVFGGSADGTGAFTQLYDISGTNNNCQGVGVTTDGDTLLFTGDVSIFSAASVGSSAITTIVDLSNSVNTHSRIQVDVANNKLYIVDEGSASIKSINLDFAQASSIMQILTGMFSTLFSAADDSIGLPSGLVADVPNSFLYWSNDAPAIQRGSIDGTGSPTTLFDNGDGLNTPSHLHLDSTNGLLYWLDTGTQEVLRGNADGSGTPSVLFDAGDGVTNPSALALDVSGGMIYFSDSATNTIFSGNADGSGALTTLFTALDGVGTPTDIELDLENGFLYFVDPGLEDALMRGSIDGSGNLEIIIGNLNGFNYFELLSDGDGDGSPDGVDQCESDANKTEPGDCGCGEVDSDDNENSISDCLLNADTKDRIATLSTSVASLKSTRTSSKRKNKKRKNAQADTVTLIQTISTELETTVNANSGSFTLTDPEADIVALMQGATRASNRARRTRSRNFKKRKKAARRALNRFDDALASS